MDKVFVSHNNIISSLGFDSESIVEKIHDNISGINCFKDKTILQTPFFASRIDSTKLQSAFNSLNIDSNYTRLEQMMITSLNNVVKASNVLINKRTGLIISTTKGNIDVLNNSNLFNKDRVYLSKLGEMIKTYFGFKNEAIVVSNACVSGILAIAIAKRFITQNMYDNVFIVSGDLITSFVLSGFNSFQALSDTYCKPYDKNRNGINLGEAIASTLVTKDTSNLAKEAVVVLGEGSCNDANHISGPSRTGEGLYRSIQSAFNQAKITTKDVDYISAHGTATVFNDEMEATALNRLGLNNIPLNSLKGYFGHTLGASGLLETIIGMHSLKNNTLYTSLGFETLGVTQPINIISKTTYKPLNTFLKTASGFGGCNTAVVFQKVK